jgi:hypothetical protein
MAAVGVDGRAREGWAIMNAGALGTIAKRHAGKGIAIIAAGVAAAAVRMSIGLVRGYVAWHPGGDAVDY